MSRSAVIRKNDGPLTTEILLSKHRGIIREQVSAFRKVFAKNGVDVDDVIQDVTLHLLNQINRGIFDPSKAAHTTWIKKVVNNYCKSYLRRVTSKLRERVTYTVASRNVNGTDPSDRAIQSDEVARLRARLSRLSPKEQRAIEAHAHGYTYPEMERAFGGTAKSWRNSTSRGLSRIRFSFGLESHPPKSKLKKLRRLA